MATRIDKAFATSGDKTAIPENSTSTELSFDEGWPSAYELEVGVDAGARDIDRGQHNQLFNIITANIKEWQEQSSPAYQSGVSYPAGATTRYTDGEYYICHTAQAAGTLPTDHGAFINAKFYGTYSYAVSQLSGGDSSLVGFIYTGLTVDSYDYLIYPGDGRIYSVGSVTGAITATFDPDDGSDTGLSGNLKNINSITQVDTNRMAHLSCTFSSGVQSGQTAGAETAQIRILNTENVNNIPEYVTSDLVAYKATLKAGRYRIKADSVARSVSGHKVNLIDASNSNVLISGSSEYSPPNAAGTRSLLDDVITLSVDTEVQLSHFTYVAFADNTALGRAAAQSGVTENYANLYIWRVS